MHESLRRASNDEPPPPAGWASMPADDWNIIRVQEEIDRRIRDYQVPDLVVDERDDFDQQAFSTFAVTSLPAVDRRRRGLARRGALLLCAALGIGVAYLLAGCASRCDEWCRITHATKETIR